MNTVNFSNTAYIYQKILEILSLQFLSWSDILAYLERFLFFIKPFSVLLSLLFLTIIIYCNVRIRAILHETEEKMHGAHGEAPGSEHGAAPVHVAETAGALHENGGLVVNKRWDKILEHINSQNPSDWRLAILECDIILDEMLTKMSYHGETLSDKLKAVEKSDFLTIDQAWEAHRVRNSIAHEGSNFQITDREARRVVSLYEDVFKEFHFI